MSGSNSSNPDAAAAEAVQLAVHPVSPIDLGPDGTLRRASSGRWRLFVVLAICAAPVITSYLMYYVVRPQARSNYASLVEPARDLPGDLPLVALDGRAVSAASLRGQWLLVSVVAGRCDAACEKRLFAQRQLREMTGRDRDRIDKVCFVTDDTPLRPDLLAALEAAPPTQVLRVPRAALAAWLVPAPGHGLDEHLYLVDPMGRWMMRAPAELDPSKFKRDLERLLRASASWDTPGR